MHYTALIPTRDMVSVGDAADGDRARPRRSHPKLALALVAALAAVGFGAVSDAHAMRCNDCTREAYAGTGGAGDQLPLYVAPTPTPTPCTRTSPDQVQCELP